MGRGWSGDSPRNYKFFYPINSYRQQTSKPIETEGKDEHFQKLLRKVDKISPYFLVTFMLLIIFPATRRSRPAVMRDNDIRSMFVRFHLLRNFILVIVAAEKPACFFTTHGQIIHGSVEYGDLYSKGQCLYPVNTRSKIIRCPKS